MDIEIVRNGVHVPEAWTIDLRLVQWNRWEDKSICERLLASVWYRIYETEEQARYRNTKTWMRELGFIT